MTVGVIQPAGISGKRAAYACDITYGTNNDSIRLPA
jgi:preprotein translocase subunit SecA